MLTAKGGIDESLRRRLIWAVRQATEVQSPLELRDGNLEEIGQAVVEPHPPSHKLDLLVLVVGRKTGTFGGSVALDANRDWPLVYARDPSEFQLLRQTLVDETGFAVGGETGLRLTRSGWDRFEQLEATRPKSTSAFVAMWFSPDMKPAYDHGFYPALYELGYDPLRVDRADYLGKIDDFIIASIRKSGLLVADFTGMRTGVFFEAGFGLGLGIPVVWTCRADWLPKAGEHFDTRQYNHIEWTDPGDLKAKLRTRIEAAVVGRPKPRSL